MKVAAALREARDGLPDILPVFVALLPIGLLFGALATGKGMSPAEATLMSLLVFAGGAQFAGLDLWSNPAPVLALAFSALLINSRHILMGTSLTPKMKEFSFAQRLAGLYFMTDEAWSLAERRALGRPLTPAYRLTIAPALGIAWVGSTLLGARLGAALGDPRSLGADFAFTAIFIGLIAGFWRGSVTGLTIAASGFAAPLTYAVAGPPWHVGAGAFAGIAAAYISGSPEEAE